MPEIRIIDKHEVMPKEAGLEYSATDTERVFWSGAYPKAGRINTYLCHDCGAVRQESVIASKTSTKARENGNSQPSRICETHGRASLQITARCHPCPFPGNCRPATVFAAEQIFDSTRHRRDVGSPDSEQLFRHRKPSSWPHKIRPLVIAENARCCSLDGRSAST